MDEEKNMEITGESASENGIEQEETYEKQEQSSEMRKPNKMKEPMMGSPDANGIRYYAVQQKKGHKLRNSLIVFGVIIAIVVVLGVSCKSLGFGKTAVSYPDSPFIAKIFVEGTIQGSGNTDYFGNPTGYQHQWTLGTIDDLINDENNKGLILYVDSPGGGVYESDELYFKIKEYQEKTGRPVYSAMGSMAASGGYYISAPCDKIIANRNCWTGSIGVTIGTLYDFSELLQRYGVKTNTMTSGPNKAMGSSVNPLTEEQKQIFQSLIDDAYDQFAGIVAEGRHMDINTVRKIGDGRIYTAKQALQLGLIDKIGTLDDAIADMKKTYKLDDCEVVDLTDTNTSVLGSLFEGMTIPTHLGSSDVAAIMDLVEENNNLPVSYMCEALNK
ncbi:signal peptide peptidase SppA [Clostridium aminobutyricum]|uniref:Signal peptide peptidase SppA n=1 Tax=Clostridium aminobutyricum TaxID=33953 RepID=A0A939IHK6_CLOAM|nr:signal peptide peptidase SppA [Clostridium aminobutyricum]MBN7772091.1 signal peptide peptidase SppA [Clostridium aminobutyricum]